MKKQKKRTTNDPIGVEYEVKVRTFNPPGLLDDFTPAEVTAWFPFIEREHLRLLMTQIYELDSDAYIELREHSAPGRNRVMFEGEIAHYLVTTLG